jgi:hypothetical protein
MRRYVIVQFAATVNTDIVVWFKQSDRLAFRARMHLLVT